MLRLGNAARLIGCPDRGFQSSHMGCYAIHNERSLRYCLTTIFVFYVILVHVVMSHAVSMPYRQNLHNTDAEV